ncbi:MAG TPA: GNAT family N-acetyltransferase [Candidatus Limnocylindrales bacterium]|nr:GNAT family N-acetyltransferase [Candidatus Limnocylindrales bacterium]
MGDLHVRSWRAAYRGIVPDAILDGMSIEGRRDSWARVIAQAMDEPTREVRIWVVEGAGQVLGLAATGPSRDLDTSPGTGELRAIYLAPEAWSRGLGSALLARAVDDLRERRFAPLILWVLEANLRGRRFYERAGWHPDGARKAIDFDGVPVDEIRYRLDPRYERTAPP